MYKDLGEVIVNSPSFIAMGNSPIPCPVYLENDILLTNISVSSTNKIFLWLY